MHGDFHEANLVFTDDGARLVDFEYCAMGDSRLDLAYLRVQFEKSHPTNLVSSLAKNGDYNPISQFEPLALAFAIGWTLERLLLMDANKLESNAAKGLDPRQMRAYCRAKLDELDRTLST
jgi:thiamine kinase-like enzyme